MKLERLLPIPVLAFAIVWCLAAVASAQTQVESSLPEAGAGIVLAKLSRPIYPPIARQARITGDVEVRVSIRKDGGVVSAYAVTGHPMLREAALKSALSSTFECRGCNDQGATYSLTYTFGLREDVDCGGKQLRSAKCLYLWGCGRWSNAPQHVPAIAESQGHITIIVDSPCIETDSETVQRKS
jgi:TonB family protein